MGNYDNDYTDETYDRYMLTGEGVEYFEHVPENGCGEEYEVEGEEEAEETVEYKDLNAQLDDVVRYLKQQIKEKEHMIKEHKKKSVRKR